MIGQLQFYQYIQKQDDTALNCLQTIHDMIMEWSRHSGDRAEVTSLRNRVCDIMAKLIEAAQSGLSEHVLLSSTSMELPNCESSTPWTITR